MWQGWSRLETQPWQSSAAGFAAEEHGCHRLETGVHPADSQQGMEPRLASTLARERRSAQGVVTTWGLFLRQDLAVWSRLASNPCSPSLHLYSAGTQVKVSFSPVSRREAYSLHFGSGKASAGIPSTEL